MNKIIEVENISKTYFRKKRKNLFDTEKIPIHACKNVSFTVDKGEIFGLLGPNGAGKTTLIKILTTLLLPTAGGAKVLGFDVEKESNKVRQNVNAMLMGERSIYWKLTGRQNLEYFASLYHIPSKEAKIRIKNLVSELNLEDFFDRKVETYSSGQKFKIAFAKSLINKPSLIFLDEPTATLDPRAAKEVRQIIKELNQEGTTIFLTTHNMYEADELSDRVAILDLGEIIDINTPDNLKEKFSDKESVKIEIPSPFINQKDWLMSLQGLDFVNDVAFVQKVNNNDGETNEKTIVRVVSTKTGINLSEIIDVFENSEIPLLSINSERSSLEDVFLSKTGRLLSEDTSIR